MLIWLIEHVQFLFASMVGMLAVYRGQSLIVAIVMIVGFCFSAFVAAVTGPPLWVIDLCGNNVLLRDILTSLLAAFAAVWAYRATRFMHGIRPDIAIGSAVDSLYTLVTAMLVCLGMFGVVVFTMRAGWYATPKDAFRSLLSGEHLPLSASVLLGAIVCGLICRQTVKRQMSAESPVPTPALTDH